jgi:hypothetical protein
MALTQSYPSAYWQQFFDEDGNPLSNGSIKTYYASDHSMPVQTYTYPGSGIKHPTIIMLDAAGRCTFALEAGIAYYIEVYDRDNNLKGTFDNVTAGGGEGGVVPVGDNEIVYVSTEDTYSTITQIINSGKLPVLKIGNDEWIFAQSAINQAIPSEETEDIIRRYSYIFTRGPHGVIEESINDVDTITAVTSDIYELTQNNAWIRHDQFLATYDLSKAIYSEFIDYKTEVDNILTNKQDKLVAGDNITINGNTISAIVPNRVQSDWAEANTLSPAYIKNKPELSEAYFHAISSVQVYTGTDLNASLAEADHKGFDIYLEAGVLKFKKGYYHVDVDVKITGATVDVNDYQVILSGYGYSKLRQTYDNTYAHDEIIHFSYDLIALNDDYALPLTVSHSIPNASVYIESIQAFDVLAWTVNGLTIPVDSELSLESENPVQNKVVTAALNSKADASSLATVATTGDYNDLLNKPNIPAMQVQSDWTETDNTKKSYIKNKPELATVAITGSYNDLIDRPPSQIVGFTTDAEANSIIADFV